MTNNAHRFTPWLVVFSASLFFFFEFMQMNMFNALDPYLYIDFHLNNTTKLGELSACYMYANIIFLFPAGIILDRYSAKKIIVLSMLVSVICVYLFSLTAVLWQAEVLRFITGIAGSFCLLSAVRIASRWFPANKMALVVGLIVTFAMIGGMVAQLPFTKLVEWYGWRHALRIDFITGCVMLALIMLLVKDFPKGTEQLFQKMHDSLEKIGLVTALKITLSNKQNWLGGLYASLINLPIFILGSTWGSWFLTQTQHLSSESASYITSMIFIGMIVGSPTVGWMSDRLRQRKQPMIYGAIASLIVIALIMYLPFHTFWSLMTLFFALGFVLSSQIIAYPLVAESNSNILTGESEGVATVMIMGGGLVIPLFPFLLNEHWNHHFLHGIPFYSVSDYHYAFWIMPIAFLIALIISFFIEETHCLSYEDRQST